MYQSCPTLDHSDIYSLILRNCSYCLLSNNYSINHKLAFWVLRKNNATVPQNASTNSVYTCAYAPTCVSVCACVCVCVWLCVCACVCVCVCVCAYLYAGVCVCEYVYVHVHVHINVHAHVHAHVHVHVHVHVHAYNI